MPPNSGAGSTSSSPHSLGLATSPLSTATFAPRREFVKSPHPISSFYLLSFAGNSFLRLSNFPSSLVRSLKQSLDPVRDFKDDPQQKLWEITLNGKPWASPKAVETERLILRILSRLLSHGFTFLSSIDYGRESDDKLTFVFSKATPSSGSSSLPSVVQIPFGLSFPSPTILRAINVPLASTPTILQALRTAWPRGISQEKKLTDGCYEFKLKGYSCELPLVSFLSFSLKLPGSLPRGHLPHRLIKPYSESSILLRRARLYSDGIAVLIW